MATPVLLTKFSEQPSDFFGELVSVGAGTVNGVPTLSTNGLDSRQCTVAIFEAGIAAGATAGDTINVDFWYYRRTVNKWYRSLNIGSITLIAGDATWDAVDRREPGAFPDKMYAQFSSPSNNRILPYVYASGYGWSERTP